MAVTAFQKSQGWWQKTAKEVCNEWCCPPGNRECSVGSSWFTWNEMRSVHCESLVFPQKQILWGGWCYVPSSKASLLWLQMTVFIQAGKGTEMVLFQFPNGPWFTTDHWWVWADRRVLGGALVTVGIVCSAWHLGCLCLQVTAVSQPRPFETRCILLFWLRGFCSLDLVLSTQLLCATVHLHMGMSIWCHLQVHFSFMSHWTRSHFS